MEEGDMELGRDNGMRGSKITQYYNMAYMYVCVYVCLSVCMLVRVYVRVYVCM